MRKVTFAILLLFLAKLQAQVVFCPPGARWTALYSGGMWNPSEYNSSIEYVRDSIQGADTTKLLRHSKFFNYCNQGGFFLSEIKQKGDTVFFRNKYTQQQWQILINYNCAVGQAWITNYSVPPNQAMQTHTFTVDSVDYVVENSIQLKRLFIKSQNSYYPTANHSVSCVERYAWGFLFQYQGRLSGCDGDGYIESLCYSDNTLGTKFFGNKACDFSNPVGLEEEISDGVISIAPSPSNGKLVVKGITAASHLRVYSYSGEEILNTIIIPNQELDVSQLPDGVYFLKMEGAATLHKIVILKN